MLTTLGWSLALMGATPVPAPAAFGGGDETRVVATTLTDIRSTPESFKGVWVTFPVQFFAVGRLHNPFFTRFVASDYANFHFWADEQPIWQREAYDDLFGLAFMNKESDQLQEMVAMDRFARLRVTGIVRNTFQGSPWIEIVSFERLGGNVDVATLAHMFRGEEHMKRRQWMQAVSELSLAPVEGVPSHVKAAVHRDLGTCYLRLGEAQTALQHLETAVSLAGDHADPETRRLLQVAANDPRAGLDREFDRQSVEEFERPLWESFADAPRTTPSDTSVGAPLPN
jgi:hypothetical protein